jgi:hypothetical protein
MAALGQELHVFTLEEAQKMLPLVKSIVRGIVEDHASLQQKTRELRKQRRESTENAANVRGVIRTLSEEVDELTARLNDAVAELEALGVEFKGYELGLVDFPARRGDEIVYLCWKYDEEGIAWWHSLESGYAGRQPLDGEIE